MLNNDESIQHPEDFWSTLPFLDGMGNVSDKSSDDQTIHPDYAKIAGKTYHITLKIPLKLDDKGKRRAGRNYCKWFYLNGFFFNLILLCTVWCIHLVW